MVWLIVCVVFVLVATAAHLVDQLKDKRPDIDANRFIAFVFMMFIVMMAFVMAISSWVRW